VTLKSLNNNSCKIFIDKCSFGRGGFAAQNITKGEVILTFTGKIITLDEVLAKDEQLVGNPLQIETKTYIDLEEPSVFINHHCNPNAGIVNTHTLVALVDIGKNEEIFYDYSTSMSEKDEPWTMECGCSAANCRKTIEDFHDLPTSIKEKYLQLGIVQEFIVREHNSVGKISFLTG
jgi:uncharacterized protein